MHALGRGGAFRKAQAGAPLGGRPDRAGDEAAAAIRADIEQHAIHARGAEGAFIGTDPRLGRVRRKVLVAIFAIGTKFQRAWLADRRRGVAQPCPVVAQQHGLDLPADARVIGVEPGDSRRAAAVSHRSDAGRTARASRSRSPASPAFPPLIGSGGVTSTRFSSRMPYWPSR